MKFVRRFRLVVIPTCLCVLSTGSALFAQAPAQQPPAGQPPAQPQQQPPPTTPPATPPPARPANPFETIPNAPVPTPTPTTPQATPATPQQTQPTQPGVQLERPKEAAEPPPALNTQVIEAFEFRGAKRVPQDTLKALIVSKPGDFYSEEALRRDFMTLWNTGRFDDIRLETEPGRNGLIVRFVVTE